MSSEGNAKWHLNYVCPLCSEYRKSFRDWQGDKDCLWYLAWNKDKFNFPRRFGFLNWTKYYFGMKTDLKNMVTA